jgi:tricorn protease
VFSVPAEKGNVLNLTNTPGAGERYAAWSPDGKSIAYWSDESGEYELHVRDIASRKEKKLTSFGPGYRYRLFWSPDSKKVASIDQAMQIWIVTVADGKTMKADKELSYYQDGLDGWVPSWSPDSRWLAYRLDQRNYNGKIVLFDTKEGKSHAVTSGYYNDNLPTFDPDGKYLYFLTNRTFEPSYSDVDGTWIYANTTGIAAAALTNETPAPMAPENDSTNVDTGDKGDKKDDKDNKKDDKKEKDKDKKDEDKPKETKITLDGFENRVVMLSVKPGNFANLVAVSGKVVFHRNPNTGSGTTERPIGFYDLEKREDKNITGDSDYFAVSADGKKILIGKDNSYAVVDISEDQKMEKKMPAGTLEMTVDPRAEWKQLFNDAWRFERDFFYDPNMHGVDWNAMKTRYGKLLDNAVTRWDVNFVIGELISELSSSHTYRGGGDEPEGNHVEVGYLGCDWELKDGAYRVKKIIRGAPWDTEVRSPLAMSGVKVSEGDYVLAVNGRPVDAKKAPWAAFQGLAKEPVTLTVNSKPSMDGAHDVLVETLDDETRLRHLAWIESEPQARGRAEWRPRRLRIRAEHGSRRSDRAGAPVRCAVQQGRHGDRRALQQRRSDSGPLCRAAQSQAARLLGRARRCVRLAVPAGRELRSQGDAHQRLERIGRRRLPRLLPQSRPGALDRHAHVGRPDRYFGLTRSDRRRPGHRADIPHV